MLTKKRFSKKINYEAIENLFKDSSIKPLDGEKAQGQEVGRDGEGSKKKRKTKSSAAVEASSSRGGSVATDEDEAEDVDESEGGEEVPTASEPEKRAAVPEEDEGEDWQAAMGVRAAEDEEVYDY